MLSAKWSPWREIGKEKWCMSSNFIGLLRKKLWFQNHGFVSSRGASRYVGIDVSIWWKKETLFWKGKKKKNETHFVGIIWPWIVRVTCASAHVIPYSSGRSEYAAACGRIDPHINTTLRRTYNTQSIPLNTTSTYVTISRSGAPYSKWSDTQYQW